MSVRRSVLRGMSSVRPSMVPDPAATDSASGMAMSGRFSLSSAYFCPPAISPMPTRGRARLPLAMPASAMGALSATDSRAPLTHAFGVPGTTTGDASSAICPHVFAAAMPVLPAPCFSNSSRLGDVSSRAPKSAASPWPTRGKNALPVLASTVGQGSENSDVYRGAPSLRDCTVALKRPMAAWYSGIMACASSWKRVAASLSPAAAAVLNPDWSCFRRSSYAARTTFSFPMNSLPMIFSTWSREYWLSNNCLSRSRVARDGGRTGRGLGGLVPAMASAPEIIPIFAAFSRPAAVAAASRARAFSMS